MPADPVSAGHRYHLAGPAAERAVPGRAHRPRLGLRARRPDHRVFRRITGQQEGLAWWNFAFLFTITVMPFTSDLLGKFSANPLAIDIFAANLLLATVATQLTVIYGRRQDLVTPETARQTRATRYRVAASVFVIAVSIVLAWVNPDAAKYCWLLLAVAPRLADRWSGRQAV